MRTIAFILLGALLTWATASASSETSAVSPYAGQEKRQIKSLSAKDIDDLKNGRGWGFAKAAELNRYPGPLHVLELEGRMRLTKAQKDRIETVYAAMNSTARKLGAQFLEAEAALNAAFADGSIDPDRLESLTMAVAQRRGALRAAHLRAHLEMREILSDKQIALYDRLRGYAAGRVRGSAHEHK